MINGEYEPTEEECEWESDDDDDDEKDENSEEKLSVRYLTLTRADRENCIFDTTRARIL